MPRLSAIALVLLSTALGAAAIEGACRLAFVEPPEAIGAEPVIPNAVKRYDGRYGWSLEPDSEGISRATGEPVRYSINSHGFRGPERTRAKAADALRIALIGDSRTFGFGVPYDQTFGHVLEGYFRHTEVLNFGVSGFGLDQMRLRLAREALSFEPDVVVAYLPHFGSHRHMHSVRFGRYKPRYELIEDRLRLVDTPPPFVAREPGPIRRALGASYALRLALGDWIDFDGDRGPSPPRTLSASEAREIDAENAQNRPFVIRMRRLAERLIDRMRQDTEAAGAQFVLMHQIRDLDPFLDDAEILSFSVRTPLANRRFWVTPEVKHVNEAGNGVLAWLLADFLREHRLVCRDDVHGHNSCRRSTTRGGPAAARALSAG